MSNKKVYNNISSNMAIPGIIIIESDKYSILLFKLQNFSIQIVESFIFPIAVEIFNQLLISPKKL